VVSKAVVVATGITMAGDREVLGLAVGDSEAETFWAEFLRSLRHRGLGGVRLVISDAHDGLTKAVRRVFQGASWQRCRVHFARNVLAKVPKGSADMVAAALRTVFVHPDPAELSAAWDRVADTFAGQFPKVTELMHNAKPDVLAFSAFPFEHWKKVWSTNPLERLNKEVDGAPTWSASSPATTRSSARLVGAVLAEQNDDLSEGSMTKLRSLRDTQHQPAPELVALS
jgi:putative transposase